MPGQIAIIGGTMRTLKRNFYSSPFLPRSGKLHFQYVRVRLRARWKTEGKKFLTLPGLSRRRYQRIEPARNAHRPITWLIVDTKFYPCPVKSSLIVCFPSPSTVIYLASYIRGRAKVFHAVQKRQILGSLKIKNII